MGTFLISTIVIVGIVVGLCVLRESMLKRFRNKNGAMFLPHSTLCEACKPGLSLYFSSSVIAFLCAQMASDDPESFMISDFD